MKPTLVYRRNTDVAHIDLREAESNAPIEVQEIGESLGFPGLVFVRFNPTTGESYGFTIQRWSFVRRKLMFRFRTLRVKDAIARLIQSATEIWKPSEHQVLTLSR
jgi:hypothetical protein